MSRALVVFESMFGNTAEVARAVARGLDDHVTTEVVEVGTAPARLAEDVDLVVVGGPTHAFGLSRPSTRQDAAERRQHPPVSPGIGVREWLALLEGATGRRAAAFATRMGASGLPGSAARGVHRRLRRLGLIPMGAPQSFRVVGTDGPLADGEAARAEAWGDELGIALAVALRGAR